ncbi:HNH endonuclease [Mesorhizobium sp.]|uniref:HNH endonuclease n=1 Tax=Mesorhizobium sp. TaxID=1871066 RepID=UPI0011FA4EC4|nr:HNH endonuclease [Mesorhizobium sp.]TIR00842.1 MAG: HNH endonuclease [Mesorhizobium sp.]
MSSNAAPWRRWYKTERWRKLRERILLRDMYICQKTGVLLSGKHPAPNSPVIHHDKEHRGNEALFWDEDNLVSVSKQWHDSEAQRQEQETLQHRGVWY